MPEALRKLNPVPPEAVSVQGDFWAPRQAANRDTTLDIEYEQLKQTGRIDAFRLDWEPGKPNKPHQFWDSDVAKWIEAAGYALATGDDPERESRVDEVIDLIADAQQRDGYLNIYFTVVDPEARWSNLRDMHELYCAGHLMEAAVAYYQGTGKRKLLDVMARYADYIDRTFGTGPGQIPGYPGHEEIELALVKLYRATGEVRYLELAEYFVEQRGRRPHYFDIEARARGDDPLDYRFDRYDYCQAHLPVRQQETAEGHAVRAMYLFGGVADVAAETGDESLLPALRALWDNVTQRRMYITGGIGSAHAGERFTYDYDLRNDLAYAETCAAIGLVFWAHRMLQLDGDGRYADVMERALYNGVLSGISLDGTRFFYANPLTVDPEAHEKRKDLYQRSAVTFERQEWFGCACCPPNIARLLASLGGYVYSATDDTAFVHLYVGGEATVHIGDQAIKLRQETRYPWDGRVEVGVLEAGADPFTLALRIPGWCEEATLTVKGESVDLAAVTERGYAHVEREWAAGDRMVLTLEMPPRRVEAHPAVDADAGQIALQRGPLVYCLEEADNGPNLADVTLPADASLTVEWDEDLLGGVAVIGAEGLRRSLDGWEDQLYRSRRSPREPITLRAIPYYAWANRDAGEMRVWIHAC